MATGSAWLSEFDADFPKIKADLDGVCFDFTIATQMLSGSASLIRFLSRCRYRLLRFADF